jgi:hypothetical protein
MKASERRRPGFGDPQGGIFILWRKHAYTPLFYGADFWGDFIFRMFHSRQVFSGGIHSHKKKRVSVKELVTYFTEKKPPLLLGSPFFGEVGGQ